MTWREASAPIIRQVIAETGTSDMQLLRKKLRAAYPWGEYAYHPLKIWRSEIQRQLHPELSKRNHGRKPEMVPVAQGRLFV